MPLDLLDTPLRMTWDLHGSGDSLPATAVQLVAVRLVEGGVFYTTLLSRPLSHPAFPELLGILADGGVRVQAVFGAQEKEWQALEAVGARCEILLDAGVVLSGEHEANLDLLALCVERLRQMRCDPVLLLVPVRQRLHLIPPLLAFCRRVGIGRFKLPNTPIDASFEREELRQLIPTSGDLAALRQSVVDPSAMRREVAMEIHDLFLWEIFFPGEREAGRTEYGGCQAANSLGHIDARGLVHPCSSWPQVLGSLLDETLAAIWGGAARLQVRTAVAQTPAGCLGCRDYAICFGGCRGATLTLAADGDGRDLLCPGRR